MWHNLNGLAQIVPASFAIDYSLVYATSRYTVIACRVYAGKSFVMTEVEICLHAVLRDVAFAVFIRVKRTGVDVDVGVELLYCDLVAACLQKLSDACGDDSFPEG